MWLLAMDFTDIKKIKSRQYTDFNQRKSKSNKDER